jgi:hypothetical protein
MRTSAAGRRAPKLELAVSIRAHFERFPASLKGSFVMRGADGNPHQVRLDDARAVELGGHGSVSMGVQPATLEVAPNRDLFVPFEFPATELASGWYGAECKVAIDGSPGIVRPESRFVVPWSRGATRRDQLLLGKSVPVGGEKVRLDQLECHVDSVQLRYEGTEAIITLAADGARLPVLGTTFDTETGSGSVTAYPLLRIHHALTIAIKGADEPVEVALP